MGLYSKRNCGLFRCFAFFEILQVGVKDNGIPANGQDTPIFQGRGRQGLANPLGTTPPRVG